MNRIANMVCLSALAFSLATFSVATLPASAKDLFLTRPAKSGVDSRIAYERAWDKACSPKPSSVTFTSKPAHGTVSVVSGTSTIPASTPQFGGTGKCAGQPIQGNEVHYLSEKGFHGKDHVSWNVVYSGGKSNNVDVKIVVK